MESPQITRIASRPVYLDSSALAKLYVQEPWSQDLEAALVGRHPGLITFDRRMTTAAEAIGTIELPAAPLL